MQPVSARRNTSIALDRSLLKRASSYGSQARLIEEALRAFIAHPDLEIPRGSLTVKDIQTVRLDNELLLWVRHFALDQQLRRGTHVTKRAIVEEVLRAYLDAHPVAAAATGGAPGAQEPPDPAT